MGIAKKKAVTGRKASGATGKKAVGKKKQRAHVAPAVERRAPVSPEALPVALVPIDAIRPSPANPRNFAGKDGEISELADNIAAVGLMSPITVRPVKPVDGAIYEVVYGERRLRACRLIPWAQIPAFVRNLTDSEAHELTVIENLHREDLSPIEEANGIRTLLDSGLEPSVIADNLGKTLSWVRKRAKLVDLSPKWREAIADPRTTVSQWTASHLELIARLDRKYQDEYLDNAQRGWYRVYSIKELARELDAYLLRLRSAPWKMDDDSFGVTCAACPKRSGAIADLFDDVMTSADDDRCLDRECFRERMAKHIRRRKADLSREYGAKLLLLDAYTSECRYFCSSDPIKKGTLQSYEIEAAKKGAADACPALVIDGPGAGELRWVKKRRAYVSSGSGATSHEGPLPLAERRWLLRGKREKELIERIKDALDAEVEPQVTTIPNLLEKQILPDVLPAVYLTLLAQTSYDDPKEWWKRYDEVRGERELMEHYTADLLREVIRINWRKHLSGSLQQTLDKIDGSFARGVGRFLGLDVDAIDASIATEIPEPKAWAGLNEDGTPKKKPAKSGKKLVEVLTPEPRVSRGKALDSMPEIEVAG